MTRYNKTHRKCLEKIANHPSAFGVKNVLSVCIEPNFYHKGGLLVQPDVIFYCRGGEYHIFEYKGNGNGVSLQRAQKQLENAVFWLAKYTEAEPGKIHTRIITPQDDQLRQI